MDLLTLPDGRILEVEITGPEHGPVLLFLHGTPGASRQLDPLARATAGQAIGWSPSPGRVRRLLAPRGPQRGR